MAIICLFLIVKEPGGVKKRSRRALAIQFSAQVARSRQSRTSRVDEQVGTVVFLEGSASSHICFGLPSLPSYGGLDCDIASSP
jgi:hypothetical protein